MAYKDTTKNMKQIGEELGVATILEGGVQRAGKQVRINVQLIDAATDAHLWAEIYTRELTAENIFAIQSEISEAITVALKAVLSPDEQQQFKKLPTQNMAALEAYFRGRSSYLLNTSEGFDEAISHFREAVALDPEFAEAYAQLALATLEKVYYGGLLPETQTALAAPLIDRALVLDPSNSEAYRALGYLKRYELDVPAAKAAFERAIELNPNNASAYEMYGNLMTWVAWDAASAVPLARKAVELDPKKVGAKSQLGEALAQAGSFQEARDLLEAIVAESPDFAQAHAALGSVLHRQFYQLDAAIKVLRKAASLDPGNSGPPWELSDTYADLGMRPEAGFWDERLGAISPDPGSENYYRGYTHQIRGETKEMIAAWESSIRAHEVRWESASVRLVDYDINSGHPEVARARLEQMLPDLAETLTNDRRRLTVRTYACALLACGKREQAQPYVDAFLKYRDATNRLTWAGVGFQDAAIFLQMGDQAAALAALHEWRSLGGCVDLTQYVYLTPLFDNADFQALNKEMLAELAKQRANLARMEAAGEIAPIPAAAQLDRSAPRQLPASAGSER